MNLKSNSWLAGSNKNSLIKYKKQLKVVYIHLKQIYKFFIIALNNFRMPTTKIPIENKNNIAFIAIVLLKTHYSMY